MAEILKECGIDADIELEEGELKFDLQPPNKAPKKSLKNVFISIKNYFGYL